METASFTAGQSTVSEQSVSISTSTMSATEPARSLSSPRIRSQSYFWAREWQQDESLADFDFLIGNTYKPADIEDLISELSDAETSQDR